MEKTHSCHQVIVSVGSNIAPQQNIKTSHDILSREARLLDSADIIETAPVGYQHQANFLNTAYLMETSLSLELFNQFLKSVEDRMGRQRGPIRSGPRTIDLDIIIWDGDVLSDDYYQYTYVSVPVDQILTAHKITLSTASKTCE